MKVLSLFDGISCGMVALERAGIPIDRYVAYEIDKYAIQVSQKNYPQIEQCGDVMDGDFTQYRGFDLLLGGSPCTHWSIANKNREITPDGIGGKLFMEYVRSLRESGCKYFLYENNYSIHKNIKAFISEQLGVEPIMINSALVSAQNRKRCYWTNIPNVGQPKDRGILLKDILENGMAWQEKSYAYTTRCQGAIPHDTLTRHRHTMVAKPLCVAWRGRYIQSSNRSQKVSGGTYQALEPRLDGKTNTLTTVLKDNNVCCPIRVGCMPSPDGTLKNGQGMRLYSVNAKSVALTVASGGLGSATGLYAIPSDKPIYVVKTGQITIKGKQYPIKLPDGYYTIRKLTPLEGERLQTLPDDYTKGISNTQRYKCIGNGWTVDVIAHILGGLKEDV